MLRTRNVAYDPEVLGLRVLGHIVGDADLGPRFLALSGLDADGLRARAGESALLAAAIAFLGSREADLTAVAAALELSPQAIVAAGAALEQR